MDAHPAALRGGRGADVQAAARGHQGGGARAAAGGARRTNAVTMFITSLFADFDFDQAQQRLKECEEVSARAPLAPQPLPVLPGVRLCSPQGPPEPWASLRVCADQGLLTVRCKRALVTFSWWCAPVWELCPCVGSSFWIRTSSLSTPRGLPMEGGFKAEFVDSARLFIFESYCRLHRRLELK